MCSFLTGARVDELENAPSKLFYLDDIPCLDLTNGTKTESAPRYAPLMSELIETGFIQFANQKAKTSKLMFSDSSADWSKWVNRYIDTILGSHRQEICMHSLRHNFKQIQLAAKGILPDLTNKIFGHAPGDVSELYGRPLSVDEVRLFIETVRSPIDLNTYLKSKASPIIKVI